MAKASNGTPPRRATAGRTSPARGARQSEGAATDASLDFLRVIWRVDHGLQRMSKQLESAFGVTGPQRLVLRIVGRRPGICAGDLAGVLHVHPSTLTGILRRLGERRLIARDADPRDGRRAMLRLTAAGKRLDVEAPGSEEAIVRRVLGRTSEARASATKRLLEALTAELEAALDA
jgi:MarR family transcriptional regulator, organic hydroperoxide resistance regulator